MNRYRITYQKTGPLRYISHLDLQKIWIRTLLRAKIPLAYTQGFHPVPKISPGWPLALGWNGFGEMIDLWFDFDNINPNYEITEKNLSDRINQNAPQGLNIVNLQLIPIYSPALTTITQSAVYEINFFTQISPDELRIKMEALFAVPSIIRSRRNKPYDLKPLIEEYSFNQEQDINTIMKIQMAARDSAMGRPDEVVDALGLNFDQIRYSRLCFILASS
jgi:radical SAM-linked protein